jgi:hypothetical protein
MTNEKKDVLEFPLEELEVPQAIVLMMQAASRTGFAQSDATSETDLIECDKRLQLLCEKLEARVEDAIEEAKAVRIEPTEEDDPNRFEDVDSSDVFLVYADDLIYQIVHKGVVFGRLCNTRVYTDDSNDIRTNCIKEFGHENPRHEDQFGNES